MHFYSNFSTWAATSCHSSVAQMGFPMHWSFSISLDTATECLPTSTRHCRGRALSISFIQWYVKPAGWLSALQPVLQCSSFLRQLKPLHKLPESLSQLGCSWPQILCIPDSRTQENILESLQFPSATDSRRTIFPGCSVQHIPHILPHFDWPEDSCVGNLLLNLFKSFLLFRAPFEIILLPCHWIERADNLTVLWNMHSPKPTAPGKACASFYLVGRDTATILLAMPSAIWHLLSSLFTPKTGFCEQIPWPHLALWQNQPLGEPGKSPHSKKLPCCVCPYDDAIRPYRKCSAALSFSNTAWISP